MKRITSLLVCLMLFGSLALHAQDIQIKGTVTGEDDGAPLPGVSVVVKGTRTGIATDINGAYSLEVPSGATLVFSAVGYQTQEVQVAGQTVINVVMQAETIGLDEVVVTALGISKAKKALGYASTEISADETLQKSEPDLLRSMQGKVPGVEIRSTGGAPGSSTRIVIRGATSFGGDNQPLIIVDGIPYSNEQYSTTSFSTSGGAYSSGLSTLDPNDIESTSVLKGAAAAALYGSRAKNGVLLITTKSGNAKAKEFSVTLNSSVNIETISNLPEYQNTYGAGHDFKADNSNGSWGARFDSDIMIPTWPGYVDAFGWEDSIPYVAQPNNVKDLFEKGIVYENSLNVQSGNENSSYNFTLSDLRNDGYIPFSSFNRTSISVGGSSKIFKRITASANASYSTSKQIGGVFGNNQSSEGYGASSFARALYLGRNWILDPYEHPVTGYPMQPNGDQFDNPLWSWRHNQIITNLDRIVGSITMGVELTSWLNLTYKIGLNSFIQRRQEIIDIGSRAVDFGKKGGITEDDIFATELDGQLLLSFNRNLADKLEISGSIGQETNQRVVDRQGFRGTTLINSGIYDIDNTESVIPFGGDYSKRRLMGVFADVTLGYSDYLYLNLTGRNDWSSTLPSGNNSYFYPGVNMSFIFSNALKINSNVFTLGKLRASWGKVGQDADPYYVYQRYFLRTGSFPFLGQSGMYTPNTAYDADLTPEFKEEAEFGTYLVFFNNRVSLDFAYYTGKSTNMIYPVFVAPSSGYSNYYTNVGQMNNNGIEVAFGVTPVKLNNGLTWDATINFTRNRNKVIEINGVDSLAYISQLFGDPASAIIVDEPYGVLYGTVSARDDEGNLLIDPGTGLTLVSDENEVYGDPNPDFNMSLINSLNFKGFTFSFMLEFVKGGDLFTNSVSTLLGRGVTKDTEDREKTVIIPGVYGNANTLEPILDGNGNKIENKTQVSVNDLYFCSGTTSSFAINSAGEWQTYDATTLRLRELSLGYDFSNLLKNKTFVKGLNLTFTARNIWYWCPNIPKYTNFDPEIGTYGVSNVQGVEYDGAPTTKRYGINLKVTF
ncbi:MAG: SusC/RagA family TonB-linked outer membrane protein [Bacteroidales bacterium]|nr:SusC/RagA family TonB-linked outer membrane protein [Bacteroidales bacterium]